jgi:hypothetical protein
MPSAGDMDRWTAERWVNNVCIESSLPASDPAWRADVLTQAVLFVRAVLPDFTALAQRAARATIGLQSAPGIADPDIDFPVGAVHLYQLSQAAMISARTSSHSHSPPS